MSSAPISCNEKGSLNQKDAKCIIEKIKSIYISKKIFNNISKKKALEIVRLNKFCQKRLNIGAIDYKEYSEKFTPIKITLTIASNKYGKFIRYIDEEEEPYFHIYFNNSEQEKKRSYFNKDEKVKTIKIIIDYQIKSFEELFYNCKCIEFINFTKIYRKNIQNMS